MKDVYDIEVILYGKILRNLLSQSQLGDVTLGDVTDFSFPKLKKWNQWDDIGFSKLRTVDSSREQVVWKGPAFCSEL